MRRLAIAMVMAVLALSATAQDAKRLIDIDPSSFQPVQTDALSGVAIDKIALDRSKRPCARIKIHINRMSREDIDRLEVKVIGGNVELTRRQTAYEGNGLIIEMTAKEQTRFYLHHDKYGDSNEVMLNLKGNREYRLDANLNLLLSIVIVTDLVGADVFVDKVYKGATDKNGLLTIEEMPTGKHQVMVTQGNIIARQTIDVSNSQISFRLITKPATTPTTSTSVGIAGLPTNAVSDRLPQIEMVFVKGGTFMMGATAEQGRDAWRDEKPAHSVTVSDFYIGKYEVTRAQWEAIMGENPSNFKDGNLPVEDVSWEDVQKFIQKLNVKTGKTYRLPTEAEWEYAARGGAQSKGYKYSGSNDIGAVAWYAGNSQNQPHPVGQKQPNELGLYDMSGNVWEWCSDWYDGKYYKYSPSDNPAGPTAGSARVLRGGSWYTSDLHTRVSFRNFDKPSSRYNYLGFRLVCLP